MEVKLSENIRAFRKNRGLTQGQLGEALNVSLGVISKWELGMSTPEIGLIMELAEFFETSVDVLLGFQQQNQSRDHILEELKELTQDRSREVSFETLERHLRRFPNDFAITHRTAHLYGLRGAIGRKPRLLIRALELTERSCELLDQNTDPEISYLSLQNDIAYLLRSLNRYEDALALYKKTIRGV